jgi:hypothetical protein
MKITFSPFLSILFALSLTATSCYKDQIATDTAPTGSADLALKKLILSFTQQGNKLVGSVTDVVNTYAYQGGGAISSEGNTVIVGGATDNGGIGATWIFNR